MTICYVAPLLYSTSAIDTATLHFCTPAIYHAISESGRKCCADRASFLAPAFELILRPGRHGAHRSIVDVLRRRGRLPLLITTGNRGRSLLGVLGAIRAMHGRKLQVPSSGLAVQVDIELCVVDASQWLECLVKELVGPRFDALILSRKEGSNGQEGQNPIKLLVCI